MKATRAAASGQKIVRMCANAGLATRLLTELTPSLVGEHSGHETTTDVCGREFRGDHSRQGVVTANTDTHETSPYNNDTNDIDSVSFTSDGLTKGSDDDDHQLDTVCTQHERENMTTKAEMKETYTCAYDRRHLRANRRAVGR